MYRHAQYMKCPWKIFHLVEKCDLGKLNKGQIWASSCCRRHRTCHNRTPPHKAIVFLVFLVLFSFCSLLFLRQLCPLHHPGSEQFGFPNPYPIYEQNLQFSLPYLWPDQKFDTLFMTIVADTVALNIIFKGLLWLLLMVLSIMMKK